MASVHAVGRCNNLKNVSNCELRISDLRATDPAAYPWSSATGGLVVGESRLVDHVDPLLTLTGLRILHERNQQGSRRLPAHPLLSSRRPTLAQLDAVIGTEGETLDVLVRR